MKLGALEKSFHLAVLGSFRRSWSSVLVARAERQVPSVEGLRLWTSGTRSTTRIAREERNGITEAASSTLEPQVAEFAEPAFRLETSTRRQSRSTTIYGL